MPFGSTIPTAPGAVPILGHIPSLLRSPLRFMSSLPLDTRVVRLRPFSMVLVCDPELNRQILLNDRIFDKGGLLFDRIREFLGYGLSSCAHDTHRRHRRLVQPAFHTNRLPGYAQVMVKQISTVVDTWSEGEVIDVLTEMHSLTARIVMATMFTTVSTGVPLTEMIDDFNVALKGAYRRMLTPSILGHLPLDRSYQRACARLRGNIARIIEAYRADGGDRDDLLSILMSSTEECPAAGNRTSLTDVEITDHLMTFFVGGTETCGALLAWTLHLLSEHPEVKDRMLAEIDTVLGGEVPKYQHVTKLEYTNRVLTEALRLYPPAWIATRITTSDTQLDGHTVHAGTTVVISPYLIQRRADLFPDPERFHPDRWLGGTSHTDALTAFAGGARQCIGKRFAMIETVLALATVVARWQTDPLPRSRVRPAIGAVIRPQGLRMRVSARKKPDIHTEGKPS